MNEGNEGRFSKMKENEGNFSKIKDFFKTTKKAPRTLNKLSNFEFRN